MTTSEMTTLSEDELFRLLLEAHRAVTRAGIPSYEIEPILLRRAREALSLTPRQARAWFYGRLVRAEPYEGP